MARGIDGIIATNTTLAALYRLTGGALPLIGVGGVASAEDALAKIRAGASAVQLYTALVFDGISLGRRIAEGLDRLLEAEGATLGQMVGADARLSGEI